MRLLARRVSSGSIRESQFLQEATTEFGREDYGVALLASGTILAGQIPSLGQHMVQLPVTARMPCSSAEPQDCRNMS